MYSCKISCLLIVSCVFFSACTQKTAPVTSQPTVSPQSQVSILPTTDSTNFTTFQNAKLTFQYPTELTITEKEGKVELHHAIPYQHQDMCNFQGTESMLDELTDVHITFQLYDENFEGTLKKRNEPYLLEQLVGFGEGYGFTIEEGFIDTAKVGKYPNAFQITNGVEGCGNRTYYVAVSKQKTLVIERAMIPELSPISAQYEQHLQLPGIIKPEQEEAWMKSILNSVQVL